MHARANLPESWDTVPFEFVLVRVFKRLF